MSQGTVTPDTADAREPLYAKAPAAVRSPVMMQLTPWSCSDDMPGGLGRIVGCVPAPVWAAAPMGKSRVTPNAATQARLVMVGLRVARDTRLRR